MTPFRVIRAGLSLFLAAAPAAATTHVVTTTADNLVGSLRQRIGIAAAGDTIVFAPSASGTLTLTNELTIGRDLFILGPSATLVKVSGGGQWRVFNVLGGTVVIARVAIFGGSITGATGNPGQDGAPGRGGGVLNAGTLTLDEVDVGFCSARGGNGTSAHSLAANGGAGEGGAIYNTGSITLRNCTLRVCSAFGGSGAGAGAGGTGGIARGGALYNAGTASLVTCTLDNNVALGGGASGSTGGDGRGGAIFSSGSLSLTHATVTANAATGGAGSTGNGDGEGGGLNGGGSVRSTLVALNTVSRGVAVGPDALGAFSSQGYNLIGASDGSSGWVATDQTGTIPAPLNPNLGALGTSSGGPTPTRRPLAGSAAIDRGGPGSPPTDQSGHPRVYDNPAIANAAGGVGSDVGAIEAQPPVAFLVTDPGDPGAGSLRRAVETAALGDSVRFDGGLTAGVDLTYGLIPLFRPLVLTGPGADVMTVRANGAPVIFEVNGSPVVISGLRLTGAVSNQPVGGCVFTGFGSLTAIEACAIEGNATTGIAARGALVVTNSTIAENVSTTGAGGIQAEEALTMENCTISGNSGWAAGGVLVSGSWTRSIRLCTVSDNDHTGGSNGAGGIYNPTATAVGVGGSVIAENASITGVSASDIRGAFTSQGFNLIGIGIQGVSSGFSNGVNQDQVGTAATPIAPMLGALSGNGGPTRTMSPLEGSPLIDKAVRYGLTRDQRGEARPFDAPVTDAPGGDGSDIGALEWRPVPVVVEPALVPMRFGLVGAAPSPFRGGVRVTFSLRAAGDVLLDVYSLDGRRVRALSDARYGPGVHVIAWDGRDESGIHVASGVYFVRLDATEGTSTRRIVRVR